MQAIECGVIGLPDDVIKLESLQVGLMGMLGFKVSLH